MSLERQFRFITDKVRVMDVPIGKVLLWLLLMGVPGKFIVRMVRQAVAKAIPPATVGYLEKVDTWTQILGTLSGFGVATLFKKVGPIKRFFGETGAEALAVGTLAGAIDAGFGKPSKGQNVAEDLSDKISDKVRDLILSITGKRAVALKPTEIPVTKEELGGLPERASSAWKEPGEEEYASPEAELGSPEEVDPIQKIEETLSELSKT